MKKHSTPDLIFSSSFFVLALFCILTLGLSGFVDSFKQLFRLITQPYGVYFTISLAFLIVGVCLSFYYLWKFQSNKQIARYNIINFLFLLVFAFLLYCEFCLLDRTYYNPFSLEESASRNEHGFGAKSLYMLCLDYWLYLAFILMPIVFYLSNLTFNKKTFIGKVLALMQPNINIVVSILFGFCISPFAQNGTIGMLDIGLLCIASLCILYFCYKRAHLLDSYSYFNCFLLIVIVVISLGGHYEFVDNEAYFEIRKAFYFLGIVSWYYLALNKLNKPHKKA